MKDIILAAAICLGACTTLVPGTVAELGALDPLRADPDVIALQVDLPGALSLPPAAGGLMLQATRADGTTRKGRFPIIRAGDILHVAPPARADLRQLQAEIRAWKAADPDGTSGSLSVDLSPCLTADSLPPDARVSVGIRVAADGPFLPLMRDAPLARVLNAPAEIDLPRCS
ncbi:MAG: hypothetical protein AAFQ19_03225 [Pseudomonadota bacterium]